MTEPDRAELLERIRSLEADKTWWKRVAVALLSLFLLSLLFGGVVNALFAFRAARDTDRATLAERRAMLAEEGRARAEAERARLKKELQAAEPDRAEKRWFRPNR